MKIPAYRLLPGDVITTLAGDVRTIAAVQTLNTSPAGLRIYVRLEALIAGLNVVDVYPPDTLITVERFADR